MKNLILVKRHPNFDNWIEVKQGDTLIDQFNSIISAIVFAKKIASKKKADLKINIKYYREKD
tara:strand:- start:226 stop:411 length:186 start_codon:yes stop_codon:yes gene_type:complete